MIKVLKTSFYTSKNNLDRLFACNKLSGQVWNECLVVAGNHRRQTGQWINKTHLQQALKQRFPLHSQSIQAVAHKYLHARDAASEARKKGHNNRYPHKQKQFFPTKWVQDGFVVHPNKKIELSLGNWQGKRQKPLTVFPHRLPQGEIKEIELIFDRKLMLAISFEDGTVPLETKLEQHIAAVDMGEIHSISCVTQNGQGLIITSRELRSIKRLRNKKHRELQRKLARLQKGSRRYRKLKRAMRDVSSKTERQQHDILHKISHNFTQWAVTNKVTSIVVGDVEGVQRNTSSRNKSNDPKRRKNKNTNQKLSQWPFGLLLQFLAYKLFSFGISLQSIPEEYTTQTCPVCLRRKKVRGRLYLCHCGYREHRDIHGAKNILSKYLFGEIRDIPIPIQSITYLRPASLVRGAESSRCQVPGLRENRPRRFVITADCRKCIGS